MKVILLADIPRIGKKYEVKEVKKGYVRNFLFPRKLAESATREAMAKLEERKRAHMNAIEESLKTTQELVKAIDGQEIVFPVKVGEKGELFEKITPAKVSSRMKELGFGIGKAEIQLAKPIEEQGEYPAKVFFEHGLEADITVIISPHEENA